MFRRLELTVRQVQERWGKRKRGLTSDIFQKRTYSDSVQRMIDKHQLEEKVHVWQAIYPRKRWEWSDEATDPRCYQFASVFWEEETNNLLSEGGYHEQPFMVARFSKFSGASPWGRGQGHVALPHVRLLHVQEESMSAAIEMQCEPPLAVDKSLFKGGVSTDSGATNFYEGDTVTGDRNFGIHAFPSTADISAVHMTIKAREDQIRSIFFNDQLQMVGGPNMTAYEVALRDSKKMMLLLPMWGRLATEFLPVFVERMNGILERRGDIPKTPDVVSDLMKQGAITRLRVTYVSPITMAQKASEAQTFQRALEYSAPMVKMNPQILDNFDLDVAVRDSQELFGYPVKYLKDIKKRDNERKAMADAARQAQGMDAEKHVAETVKTAGEAAGNLGALTEAAEQLVGGDNA